jgi:hypothetical protein
MPRVGPDVAVIWTNFVPEAPRGRAARLSVPIRLTGPIMTISDRQLRSLHNLADKQAGHEVDWINIADARALTELGLARRNRGGWEITTEGLALIKAHSAAGILVQDNDAAPAGAPTLTDEGQ